MILLLTEQDMFLAIIFSKFVNLIFGKDITDIFSGFRIFSKRFIKTFPQNSTEFEIEAELTIHALEQKIEFVNSNVFIKQDLPAL